MESSRYGSQMSNEKSGKQLTLDWFERVWNGSDERAIHELTCPDCEIKGLEMPMAGPDGFVAMHRMFQDAFSDINVEVLDLVEEDGHVAGHAQFHANHRSTDKPVSITFSISVKWRDGRMTEARNVVDYFGLLTSLGLVEARSLSAAFGG